MYQVLVVEDDPNLLQLYKAELEDEGYKILVADDGEKAINITKSENPDLVILDLKIAKIEGLEVLRKLKEHRKSLPVILNSAYSTFKSNFISWMADAYIVKSSRLDELKQKIKELLP